MAIDPGTRAQRALRVVRSTTAESLCSELARRISGRWASDVDGLPRIGAFDRVVVAVQGKGLERWMRRRLAHRLGVVGGIETPYLRRFLFDIAGLVTGDVPPSRDRDDVIELAYRVAQEIADRCAPDDPEARARSAPQARAGDAVPHVDAAHVLPLVSDRHGGRTHPHALLAAGHRLAAIFDALEVERPELVVAWRAGRPMPDLAPWLRRDAPEFPRLSALCAWMHRLWWWTAGPGAARGAAQPAWSGHRAWQSVRDAIRILSSDGAWRDAQERLAARLATDDRARLPAMVSVFGVSSLPPLALDFIAALGSRIDVTLHLIAPTDQYMDESVMGRAEGGEPDEEHLDSLWSRGQRLLAVCGRQPMSMQQRLLSLGNVEDVECGSPWNVGRDAAEGQPDAGGAGVGRESSLHALQRSLRDGTPMDRDCAGDGSISVHMVSGATRAAEVLRDQVLDAFASLPGTGPDDVLVLTTDVERYGAAIARVMGAASPRPVPVTLADRSMRAERAAVRTFCDALRIIDGELTIDSLAEVVASATVAGRAGVSVEECSGCLDRLRGVGARRFIDADHRQRVLAAAGGTESRAAPRGAERAGSPGDAADAPDGTVTDAADRLALALAMSHEVAGTQIPGMARICAMIDELMSLGRRTSESRPLADWCAWARDLLDALVPRRSRSSDGDDLHAQRAAVLDAIESLAAAASQAGLKEPLPFAAARVEIMDAIDRGAAGRRFGAAGGVTVGGLVPMRSVPSRIVALVGLDRGVFPRRDERSGVDPRRWSRGSGDRSARDEDRALFLEAIHAASDRLIVISNAVDAASGAAEPPSPLVDLLREQCGAAARVICHGVHSFGEEEWAGTSADRPRRDRHARLCALARRAGAAPGVGRRVVCPEIRSPVRVSDALLLRIESVDHIVKCIEDPSQWWLDAIGAKLAPMDADAALREPSALGGIEKWSLKRALIEQAVTGAQVSVEGVVADRLRAGVLPEGVAGDAVTSMLRTWIERDVRSSSGFSACPAEPREWSVEGPGGPLMARGWISVADPATQVLFRGGAWRDCHAFELALRAAAWAAAGGARTVVIPKPDSESGMPAEIAWSGTPAEAARALHELRAIAAAGMVTPLCFHPMLLADSDIAGLRAGTHEAREAIERTLDEWLSRPTDDLSIGQVDARALRAVMQGLDARRVMDCPRAEVAIPPEDASSVDTQSAVGACKAPVRTDFDGVWPAVERLLAACGWSGSADDGGAP